MPLSPKNIRIPVRLVDGYWELLYGGPVKVKDGSIGELHVSRDQIEDEVFLKSLTEKRLIRILDQGTELRVALSIREPLPEPLNKLLVQQDKMDWDRTAKISVDSRFVIIHLGGPNDPQTRRGEKNGGLWLTLEGMEPRGLESSEVILPEVLKLDPAISVNHAFTLLSEYFEPWRKAHTGSIYERVFYRETNSRWYRVGDLREKELAVAERAVIKVLWQEVKKVHGQIPR